MALDLQYHADGNPDFLREQWPTLEKPLLWLRCQDSNGCCLLDVQEAAGWADLLANRFNILYANVLCFAVLRAVSKMSLFLDGTANLMATWLTLCATSYVLC